MKKIKVSGPGKSELKKLHQLKNTFEPGRELEEKIFHQFKFGEQINSRRISLKPVTAIVAIIIFFLIGFSISKLENVFMNGKSTKADFILLVYELDNKNANSASRVKEYTEWITNLRKNNPTASGEKLKESGKVLLGSNASDISNIAVEDRISGYFLFEAENYKEAISIAETCPHLRYGGKLEVREIHNLNNNNM